MNINILKLKIKILGFCFFSCLFYMMTSCKLIKVIPYIAQNLHYAAKQTKMHNDTKEVYKYKREKFILKDNYMFIPSYINDKADTLLYDTGSINYFTENVRHDSVFKGVPKMTVKIMTVSKIVKATAGLLYYNIITPWFESTNYVGEMLYIPKCEKESLINCDDKQYESFSKVIGYRLLPNAKQVLMINFSDTTLFLGDSSMVYDTIGYFRVNGYLWNEKTLHLPIVYLTIDSVDYEFIFDTGSPFGLSIPKQQYSLHKKINDLYVEGMVLFDLSGIFKCDTVIFQNNTCVIMEGLDDTVSSTFMYLDGITHNNMGMSFISGFDWILDKNRNVIFAKPLRKDLQFNINCPEYTVNIIDTSLLITIRVLNNKYQLPLYSIIDTVDGQKVTKENICAMKTLLNKKHAFTEHEIVVLPPTTNN